MVGDEDVGVATFSPSIPSREEETNRGSIDPELRISLSGAEPFTLSRHPNFRHQPFFQFEKQDFPLVSGEEKKRVGAVEERK